MWPSWKENKPFSLALIVLLSFLSIFVWAKTQQSVRETAQVGRAQPLEHTFSVEGEAKVSMAPNMATVSFGVLTKGASAAEAQNKNTETSNALLALVKKLGIADADVQTSDYTSYPNMVWNTQKQTSEQVGWIFSQTVSVKLRDTSKVGALLQTVGQNGATNISGPNFAVEDTTVLKDKARADALADARGKAERLAAQLGVRLGKVIGYNEYADNPGPTPMYLAKDVGGNAASIPTVAEGSTELTLHVSVTYVLVD